MQYEAPFAGALLRALKTLNTITIENITHTYRKVLIRNIKEVIPYDEVEI